MSTESCRYLHELNRWFVASHEHYGESSHGHNFQCRVIFDGIDRERQGQYLTEVIEDLDYRHLNRLPFFRTHTPSTENIARFIFRSLAEMGCDVREVDVVETAGSSGGVCKC